MNVVQQLPQPQHLNIMGLSIFPDIMNPSKVATEAAKFYNAKGSGNFCKAVKKGIKLYNSYWKNNGNC